MSEIIGKQIEVGIAVEETRGTPQGTAEHWFKNVTASIVERAEKAVDDSNRNRIEDSLGARLVKKWVEGDLEGIVHADAIGYLFYNIYGAVSSGVVSGSVYDHTFSVANSIQHPSLTLIAKDGANSQDDFTNAMVGSLEISASVDDYVRFTASFMAGATSSNADTPAYVTEYDFVGKDITVKFADTEGGLAGATATKVKEVTVSWDQGLIADHVLGSYTPDDIYDGNHAIEVQITPNYEDDTFKDLYTAGTYKYMQVVIQGSQDIGGGSNPTITLILNRVQVMDWNREGGRDELITQPITVKAFYNETDSEMSSLVLRNLTTEYDTVESA